MPASDRVPAGRAGRLWLVHRVSVAERGADQLERKVQLIASEIVRARQVAQRSRATWDDACRDAELWAARAGLVGGSDGIRRAWAEPVDVDFGWANTVGVRHPHSAQVSPMALPDVPTTTAALVTARKAFVMATHAAAELGAADAAVEALDEALRTARARARILRRHWIPVLRNRLHDLEFALEQAEQEDHARLRRIGTP
jgi:V/A-type H+-transporting ATPase subunit D